MIARTYRMMACAAVLALLAVACGSDSKPAAGGSNSGSSQHRSITILQTSHSLGSLALYVAKRMGYFDDVNVDVQFADASGDGAANTALLVHGDGWALVTGPEQALLAQSKGVDLRAIVSLTQTTPFVLVGPPSFTSSGNLANDLKGKKIAASGIGSPPHETALEILRYIGVDPDHEVTLIEGSDNVRVAALASGEADFAFLSQPSLEKTRRAGISGEPLFIGRDAIGDYPANAVMVLGNELDADPATAQHVVDAIVRAEHLMFEHPDQALALAQAEFSDVDPDVMRVGFEFQTQRHLFSADGKLTDTGVANTLRFASHMAGVPEDQLDPAKAIDHRFGA